MITGGARIFSRMALNCCVSRNRHRRDESGRIILSESNIYCDRALAIIKEANSNDD